MFIKIFNNKKVTKNISTKRRITENTLLSPANNSLLPSIFRNTRKRHWNLLKNNITNAVSWRCSIKKVLLEISQNSQENNCAKVPFFNKVAGLNLHLYKKNRLWHRCFPVNFATFLTYFLTEHLWWLLLTVKAAELYHWHHSRAFKS